jgi:glycosyltransferase involved in cell wall biosynthesis
MLGNDINLIVFFTYGVSLKIWSDTGLLEREIKLYKRLIQNGVNVSFITYGDNTDYEFQALVENINILPLYSKLRRPKSRILRLVHSFILPLVFRSEMRESDILKTKQILGGWNAVLCKWIWKKPLLVRCGYELYSFSIKQNKPYLYKTIIKYMSKVIYSQADKILITTRRDKNFIHKTFNIDKLNIEVQSNWIDSEIFNSKPIAKEHSNRVLYVGRLNKQKNLYSLIKAFANTQLHLDIIGEGEEEAQLREYALKYNAKVKFIGKYPNNVLSKIYKEYPVYILCSFYEGNPKTLLEAMACGRAVIGSNVSGINDIIEMNHNGILCETNSKSIGKSIKLLFNNKELRKHLGKNARIYVENIASLNCIIKHELKVYQDLINNSVN